MSMYGDNNYCMSKEYLFNDIEEFLEEHPISELLEVIADAIRNKESEGKE